MKFFKVPEIKIPTDAEMKVIAENWWSNHKGINFIAWHNTLLSNSYPIKLAELPKSLIKDIINLYDAKGNFEKTNQEFESIIKPILEEVGWEENFFVKLITRSPKDYLADEDNHTKPRALKSTKDALEAILSSMRCFEDLCLLQYLDIPVLVLRPYVDFHPSQEWRVFVKDKQIQGITQYYYNEVLHTESSAIAADAEIRSFMESVIPNVTNDSFVADIITKDNTQGTTLLELNPYGLSDPCLFKQYSELVNETWWNNAGEVSKIQIK